MESDLVGADSRANTVFLSEGIDLGRYDEDVAQKLYNASVQDHFKKDHG